MGAVNRARRAEIVRIASSIRQHGGISGWTVERIASVLMNELPEITPLEAWRLAHGWTRPQVIEGMAAMYTADGLAPPPLNSSMLCRWEHGESTPSDEYADALCRLYQVDLDQLGLAAHCPDLAPADSHDRYSRPPAGKSSKIEVAGQRTENASYPTNPVNSDDDAATLTAVHESIHLGLEIEGPAGGSFTYEQLEYAIEYYALNYAAYRPSLLAMEVRRSRSLVINMLSHVQTERARSNLWHLAGWLSALLGNLAFHLADHVGAYIHLGTAAQLGAEIGEARLVCWSLGAKSMVARYQHRHGEAVNLARKASAHITSPLIRAQLLTWAELPALIRLGTLHPSEAVQMLTTARNEMNADPKGEQPGRFGFDIAEFELHVAEAHLALDDPTQAAVHAKASLEHTKIGRPGWAAAVLVLAASEVRRNRPDQAADLAMAVLDIIPAHSLRGTTRQRLALLDAALGTLKQPDPVAADLRERLRTLSHHASLVW